MWDIHCPNKAAASHVVNQENAEPRCKMVSPKCWTDFTSQPAFQLHANCSSFYLMLKCSCHSLQRGFAFLLLFTLKILPSSTFLIPACQAHTTGICTMQHPGCWLSYHRMLTAFSGYNDQNLKPASSVSIWLHEVPFPPPLCIPTQQKFITESYFGLRDNKTKFHLHL